jgi:hypothetical protein
MIEYKENIKTSNFDVIPIIVHGVLLSIIDITLSYVGLCNRYSIGLKEPIGL